MDHDLLMFHVGALEDAVRFARKPMVDALRGREALLQAAEALIAAIDDDTHTYADEQTGSQQEGPVT